MKIPVIAIVGAGFSGLMCCYHIVRKASCPVKILMFDASSHAEKGIAYSTDCPLHKLNVAAEKMGAFQDDPEHFFKWLSQNPDKWQVLHPTFKNLRVAKDAFFPRMIYGQYLVSVREDMQKLALLKGISIDWIKDDVFDIEKDGQHFVLTTNKKKVHLANHVALAVSTPWTQDISHNEVTKYFETAWPHFTSMEISQGLIDNLPSDAVIGIIGTGLTMLDVLATLKYCGFDGRIVLISSKNLLPQSHLPSPPGVFDESLLKSPLKAVDLFRTVRLLCQKEGNWRSVIDGLRPKTAALWQRMSAKEKRSFLRWLFRFWNSHRHRAPPEMLEFYNQYRQSNKIETINARVESVDFPSVSVKLRHAKSGRRETKKFDLVINCSGPGFHLKKNKSPLIQNLLRRALSEPDELGLGLKDSAEGLFIVGSLLFGTYFECTAVPEIRQRCSLINQAFNL